MATSSSVPGATGALRLFTAASFSSHSCGQAYFAALQLPHLKFWYDRTAVPCTGQFLEACHEAYFPGRV